MTDTPLQHSSVPTYSLAERDRRWTLARMFMERRGLDALLILGEHEDAGPAPFSFDSWFTNDRDGMTVLFPRTADPIVFVPIPLYLLDHMEAVRRGDGVWIAAKDFRRTRFQRDRRGTG